MSFEVLLWKHHKNKRGLFTLKLRIQKRGTAYLSMNIHLKKDQWKRGRVVGHDLAARYNTAIRQLLLSAENIHLDDQHLSAKQIIHRLKGSEAKERGLIDKALREVKESNLSFDTKKVWTSALKRFKAFDGDPDNIMKWHGHLWKESSKNNANDKVKSVKKALKRIGHVITVKLPPNDPTIKKALPSDVVDRMELLELEGWEDRARDLWLFSYYCGGIRFKDLGMSIKWECVEHGWLRYRMNKTGKIKNVPLRPKALEILKKYKNESAYIFPFVGNTSKKCASSNTQVNNGLKKIAKRLDVKGFSTRSARHSFATRAKRKVDIHTVKDMLGHSDLRTTEIYLASLDDLEMEKSFGEVFD